MSDKLYAASIGPYSQFDATEIPVDTIAIGTWCQARHDRAIVIGDAAQSCAQQQLVINTGGVNIVAPLTADQHKVLFELFAEIDLTQYIRACYDPHTDKQ